MKPSGAPDGREQKSAEGAGTTIIRALLLGLGYALVVPLLPFRVRILREYQRGVMFRLGRFEHVMGPGLVVMLPIVDRMAKVDLRVLASNIPPQEIITRDNVPVTVDAVLYFRIVEPARAVLSIEDYMRGTSQIAQTTLRSVLGQSDLDELLSQREQINQRLQEIIDEATDPWGVKVSAVEVKEVELPASMQRAMARQAEAERERRGKVIAADGEFQASERLRAAAEVMAEASMTLSLRYMQALGGIAAEQGSTILFPVPIDLSGIRARARGRAISPRS